MNDLIVVPQTNQWQKLKALVLDSVSSPITKRVYNLGLDEFFAWYGLEPRAGFTKATVSAWRVALEARGLGSVSINVRITAVRKLAAVITRVKGAKSIGVRVGNWLSVQQAQKLLNAPDVTTKKGLRDRAMLLAAGYAVCHGWRSCHPPAEHRPAGRRRQLGPGRPQGVRRLHDGRHEGPGGMARAGSESCPDSSGNAALGCARPAERGLPAVFQAVATRTCRAAPPWPQSASSTRMPGPLRVYGEESPISGLRGVCFAKQFPSTKATLVDNRRRALRH